MRWYIGQPIVAIKNHSQGCFKSGDEFVIKGIKECPCKCPYTLIDIGIRQNAIISFCSKCGHKRDYDGHFSENCFAPLDVDISELTEILTKKLQLTQQ